MFDWLIHFIVIVTIQFHLHIIGILRLSALPHRIADWGSSYLCRMNVLADGSGYGGGSTKNSPFRPSTFIRYFFAVVCVIAILMYGHFLSILHSSISLLPVVNNDYIDQDRTLNHRPSNSSSKYVGDQRQQQQCGIWMAPSSLRPYPG